MNAAPGRPQQARSEGAAEGPPVSALAYRIDGKLATLQQKFDERHADASADERQALQARLDKQFDELRAHRPEMAALIRRAVDEGVRDGAHFHPGADAFGAIAGESVDYVFAQFTPAAGGAAPAPVPGATLSAFRKLFVAANT